MAEVTFLDKVKTALRISHTKLDDDIQLSIDAAEAEMIRAGVDAESVDTDDPLIAKAVITFVKQFYANDQTEAEKYAAAWQMQLDNLRKSAGYRAEADDGE